MSDMPEVIRATQTDIRIGGNEQDYFGHWIEEKVASSVHDPRKKSGLYHHSRAVKPLKMQVEQQASDIKFLLSFAPDKPPPGLDPTFYHTLTHEGDMELWNRVEKIKKQQD